MHVFNPLARLPGGQIPGERGIKRGLTIYLTASVIARYLRYASSLVSAEYCMYASLLGTRKP